MVEIYINFSMEIEFRGFSIKIIHSEKYLDFDFFPIIKKSEFLIMYTSQCNPRYLH